jgi:hypothetical protein
MMCDIPVRELVLLPLSGGYTLWLASTNNMAVVVVLQPPSPGSLGGACMQATRLLIKKGTHKFGQTAKFKQ